MLAVVALATAASAQTSDQPTPTQVLSPCLTGLAETAADLPMDPIVVGCDTVDCCPGPECAGDDKNTLDWVIDAQGTGLDQVNVSFDTAPEKSTSFGPGKNTINGLPLVRTGTPPTGTLSVATKSGWSGPAGPIDIKIDQKLGDVSVSEFWLRIDVQACQVPTTGEDRVDLTNNTDNDSAIVLMSERKSSGNGCEWDTARATDSVGVGNKVPGSGSCKSSVSVFSDDNAMAWVNTDTSTGGSPTWTPNQGDVVPIALQPPLVENVNVYVFGGGSLDLAYGAVDFANERFNANNVGIQFNAVVAEQTGSEPSIDCLTTPNPYTEGRVNVYYVSDTNRLTCRPNPNVVFVGGPADVTVLAHELGHSLGLLDFGYGSSFGDNIMQDTGTTRDALLDGQVFRMNMHCGSSLHRNKVRGDPDSWPWKKCLSTSSQTACGTAPLDANCPPVQQNVDPK